MASSAESAPTPKATPAKGAACDGARAKEGAADAMAPSQGRLGPRLAAAAMMAMRKAGALLVLLTFVLLVVAIPLYSVDLWKHGAHFHIIGYFSAGAFALITFPLSMHEIFMHLTNWYMPSVQRYVVRILWMVPLYSVESYLSLRFHAVSLYVDTFRDMYEAYVIYCFSHYLIELLGSENSVLMTLKTKAAHRGRHPWPLKHCLKPWAMGKQFLYNSKLGVLQYVVIKVLTAVATMILEWCGRYGENSFSPRMGYVYLTVINNFSQCWALYCMVFFYHVMREELMPWRPVGKFISVKAVVFFTYWQSICIVLLRSWGVIRASDNNSGWTSDDIATGIQDWLICIEMFIAALAHRYTFTYRDYHPRNVESTDREPFLHAFFDSTVPSDMFADLRRAAEGKLNTTFHDYQKLLEAGVAEGEAPAAPGGQPPDVEEPPPLGGPGDGVELRVLTGAAAT